MSNPEEPKPEQNSFEVNLTLNQLEVIASQMPQGYSLQFSQPLQKHNKQHQKAQSKKSSKPKPKPKQPTEESSSLLQQPQLYQRQSLRKQQKQQQQPAQKYSDTQQKSAPVKSKSTQTLQQVLKACYKILTQLKRNESAAPFLQPVNPLKLGIPDYFTIIANPMDLSTIDRKLRQGIYKNEKEFYSDMKLIWNNSYQYNMKGSDI